MYESILHLYEMEYFQFLLTLGLGFLTGLELRQYKPDTTFFIGTVRTYMLIGMLGFVLYLLDPTWKLYLAGFGVLSILFALFYYRKLNHNQKGIISLLVGLLVYTYPPLIVTQPLWFIALVFVSIVFVVNAKSKVQSIVDTVDNQELMTFSKLVLLSAVIWPLLPTTPISAWIPMSFSKIWIAVMVVAGISYVGYILQRYFFREKGFLINGIIGGIYSSTATTLVLSRQAKVLGNYEYTFVASILYATAMMHLRFMVIIGSLNFAIFKIIVIPLAFLTLLALVSGYGVSKIRPDLAPAAMTNQPIKVNPLELGFALLFAAIFVIMSVLTSYFINNFGISGLNILAFIIGFTDIDPFILSLINSTFPISQEAVVSAILITIGSNNVLKGIVAMIFGPWKVGWMSFTALGMIAIGTFILAYFW